MTPERLSELRSFHPPHAAPAPPCLLCELLTALERAWNQIEDGHFCKAGLWYCHDAEAIVRERDALQRRVEALGAYAIHTYQCATLGTAKDPMHAFPIINPGACNCGLDAALQGEAAG